MDKQMEYGREDYFTYKDGDVSLARSQCELCRFYRHNEHNENVSCVIYTKGIPDDTALDDVMCEFFEAAEN